MSAFTDCGDLFIKDRRQKHYKKSSNSELVYSEMQEKNLFQYLEEYYKSQFCSQHRPVLFREGVGF